ncbi:mycofactocin-coupled SDR family oxidoreductase [Streptomyces sp. AC512_CC834]|uniref:mycofactocin-coupled SDR family oxidoreductase n=1 Tax=Streptomyces sp. AC512_CC834 TaxID=2823691 RepID=UPI001C25EF19|nr:mycofactocin-coupled SDR family oxidoreductase [Streptomyces sp. AC512_CC834]
MGRVEGKVVVITGAARGQGRSHAVRLAEEGADIIAIDLGEDIEVVGYPLGTAEELAETARLVEKTGRRVVTKLADTRDRAALRQAIDEGVAQLGRLDVVVANAAIGPVGADRPLTAFADAVDVNLSGTLNTVHAALPHLQEGASVILIGSAAAYFAAYGSDPGGMGPGGIGYAFTKQMLGHYVNWFAPFLAPQGLRINVVHPTNVNTPMLHNEAMYKVFRPDLEHPVAQDAEPGFSMVQALPIPYVEPIDVSHAVAYLASDESRFVTGTQLRVDGGAVVKNGK